MDFVHFASTDLGRSKLHLTFHCSSASVSYHSYAFCCFGNLLLLLLSCKTHLPVNAYIYIYIYIHVHMLMLTFTTHTHSTIHAYAHKNQKAAHVQKTYTPTNTRADKGVRAAVARQPVLARLLSLGAEYAVLDMHKVIAVVSGPLKV
jgi:hypothetical protein